MLEINKSIQHGLNFANKDTDKNISKSNENFRNVLGIKHTFDNINNNNNNDRNAFENNENMKNYNSNHDNYNNQNSNDNENTDNDNSANNTTTEFFSPLRINDKKTDFKNIEVQNGQMSVDNQVGYVPDPKTVPRWDGVYINRNDVHSNLNYNSNDNGNTMINSGMSASIKLNKNTKLYENDNYTTKNNTSNNNTDINTNNTNNTPLPPSNFNYNDKNVLYNYASKMDYISANNRKLNISDIPIIDR